MARRSGGLLDGERGMAVGKKYSGQKGGATFRPNAVGEGPFDGQGTRSRNIRHPRTDAEVARSFVAAVLANPKRRQR